MLHLKKKKNIISFPSSAAAKTMDAEHYILNIQFLSHTHTRVFAMTRLLHN